MSRLNCFQAIPSYRRTTRLCGLASASIFRQLSFTLISGLKAAPAPQALQLPGKIKTMTDEKPDEKPNTPAASGETEISRRRLLGSTSLLAVSVVASTTLPRPAAAETPTVLPPPEPPFQGKIGRTVKDS